MIDLDEMERLAKESIYVPGVPDGFLLPKDLEARNAFREVTTSAAILELIAEVRRMREALSTPMFTGADAPVYGGIFGVEGVSRDAAETAFYTGAPTVTVYYGERRVFTNLAEFCAAHPREKA